MHRNNPISIFPYSLFFRFKDKVYRQVVGISRETNGDPFIEDVSIYCYVLQFRRHHMEHTKH